MVRNRSTASENQIKLRVVVEDDNGGKTDAADFSVFFSARTVS